MQVLAKLNFDNPLFNKLQVFRAEIERSRPVDLQHYQTRKVDERSKVLSVGAAKTGTIDVDAKKVFLCYFKSEQLRQIKISNDNISGNVNT